LADAEPGGGFTPRLTRVVGDEEDGLSLVRDPGPEIAVGRLGAVIGSRGEQAPGGELDHPIVVGHEIAGAGIADHRIAPRAPFVGRSAQAQTAIHAGIFLHVEERDPAIVQPQERHAHDVALPLVGHEEAVIGGPGLAAVRRATGGDVGGGVVAPALAGVARVGEEDVAIAQRDERAFGVARIVGASGQREHEIGGHGVGT